MSWNIKTPGDYINGPLTVAGSATITGDLTVDTNVLKVDTTNDRVGIGKASPGYKLVVAAATTDGMQFENTSDSNRGGRITNTGTAGVGKFGITTTSSGYGLSFGIDAVEKMLLDTSNNLNITSGNVVMATSGKGIDFSATAGTGTSELLNDYEEGTWTPVVTATSGTLTSVTSQTGAYTKIGRMVTVTGFFTITTNGTGASNIAVAGLPFANGNLINVGVGRVDGTTGNMFQAKISASAVIANIWTYDNNYPAANGAQFSMTLVYYV